MRCDAGRNRSTDSSASGDRPLAVVLLSGGMDSLVAAALVADGYRLACLHVTYGQRTANRERVCFGALAHHLGADTRLVIELEHLARIGGSALTDAEIAVPDAEESAAGIPITYVPFRNAHLLAAGVSWAEVLDAKAVVLGAVEADSAGYPDCRKVFCEAFAAAVAAGTRPETHIEILTPVIDMSKAAIVRRGHELRVPFHLTWSCYRNESLACGRCDSCRLRLAAFAAAGHEDPIAYELRTAKPGNATRQAAGGRDALEIRAPGATPAARPAVVRGRATARARIARRLTAFLQQVRRS